MGIIKIEWIDLDRAYPVWGEYWPNNAGDQVEPLSGDYYHQKTYIAEEGGAPVIDNHVYRNNTPYGSFIRKEESEQQLYWHYEALYHFERINTNPIQPNEELAYHDLPYPAEAHEHVIDHNTQSDTFGSYYPYLWTHLEISDTIFAQGLLFVRAINGGDNLKRSYMNGVSWLNATAVAVGATEANVLGIAYIPGTDRLNN